MPSTEIPGTEAIVGTHLIYITRLQVKLVIFSAWTEWSGVGEQSVGLTEVRGRRGMGEGGAVIAMLMRCTAMHP